MEKENGVKMEKEGGVKMEKEGGVEKPVAGPEGESVTAPAVCYKNTVGEDAKFMDSAKDYLKQLKDTPVETRWICIKNRFRAAGEYVSQKSSSMFGKQKVEPEVKHEAPEVPAPAPAPAPAAAESN